MQHPSFTCSAGAHLSSHWTVSQQADLAPCLVTHMGARQCEMDLCLALSWAPYGRQTCLYACLAEVADPCLATSCQGYCSTWSVVGLVWHSCKSEQLRVCSYHRYQATQQSRQLFGASAPLLLKHLPCNWQSHVVVSAQRAQASAFMDTADICCRRRTCEVYCSEFSRAT